MSDTLPPRPELFAPAAPAASAQVPTPTQEVVQKRKNRTASDRDALGRVLRVKWLSPLERMRLVRLLGKDASNEVYLGYATLASSCTHIDDDDVSFSTIRELEALVDRLGDEGLDCIGGIMKTAFKDLMGPVDVDTAKN